MKYILTNKQAYDAIMNYLHNYFSDDDLDWEYELNDDYRNAEYDKNIVNFYGEKYREGQTDDYTFTYITKNYYEIMDDEEFKKKWIDKAPLLDFLNRGLEERLDIMFGPFWKPIFEEWFRSVYPEFPVKTFVYKR